MGLSLLLHAHHQSSVASPETKPLPLIEPDSLRIRKVNQTQLKGIDNLLVQIYFHRDDCVNRPRAMGV